MSDNDTLICFFCEQSFPMDQEGSIMMSNYNEEVHACAPCVSEGKLADDFSNLIQKDKPSH